MGQPILYCAVCGRQLRTRDFDDGKAVKVEGRAYCRGCTAAKPESAPAPPAPQQTSSKRKGSTRRSQASSSPRGSRPSPLAIPIAAAAAVGLVGILVVALLSGNGGARTERRSRPAAARVPPETGAPRRTPPSEPAAEPESSGAAKLLEEARALCLKHPKDFARQIAAYEGILPKLEGTDLLDVARKDLEVIRQLSVQALDTELSSIRGEAERLCEDGRFGEALRLVEQASDRHPGEAWSAGLDTARKTVRERAEKRLEVAVEEAVQARRGGEEKGVRERREEVASWPWPDLVSRFDASLAALPPLRDLAPGNDISAWGFKEPEWRVRDGILESLEPVDGERHVFTRESFGEFDLTGHVSVEKRGYFEFQIWTYARVKGKTINPGWKPFRVVARRDRVQIYLDGTLAREWTDAPKRTSGKIAFFSTVACRLKDLRLGLVR